MRKFRKLPSPAMMVGLAALFVALGGTAAAVTVDFAKNAHKVDGRHANEIVRLAAMHVTADVDNWDGTTITDSRTIKAPKKGLILITYTANMAVDFNATGTGLADTISATPEFDGSVIGDTAWGSLDYDAPCCPATTMTVQRVLHVGKGLHTVSVDLQGPGGTQTIYVYERSLSVLYVPFKGDGTVGRVLPLPKVSGVAKQPQG